MTRTEGSCVQWLCQGEQQLPEGKGSSGSLWAVELWQGEAQPGKAAEEHTEEHRDPDPCPQQLRDAQKNLLGICSSLPSAESSSCSVCIRHAGEVEPFAERNGEGGQVPTHEQ